jgi:hypothetical protein
MGERFDLVAKDKDGKLCLIDLKTSKRISDGYVRQIAGYTELWDYNIHLKDNDLENY